jgi:hypothetical protein
MRIILLLMALGLVLGCRPTPVKMTPQKITGKAYAGNHQFYLFDADRRGNTAAPGFFDREAMETRLPIGRGVVGIMTSTDGEVPVTLESLEGEPTAEMSAWAHIVEAPLQVSKGRIQIVGCPDEPTQVMVNLPPGDYIVRVSFSKVIEGDSDLWAGDSYQLQVYPGKIAGRRVLKHHALTRPE